MRSDRIIRIGLRVVLAVSLLLNAATIGVVWTVQSFRTEYGLRDLQLPRSERRLVRAALRARRDEVRPALVALGEARRDFVALASADPMDVQAVEAAMAEVRARSAALQRITQGIMVDALRVGR